MAKSHKLLNWAEYIDDNARRKVEKRKRKEEGGEFSIEGSIEARVRNAN